MPTRLTRKSPAKAKTSKIGNPLDSERHVLLEQQNQLQAQIEALQRSIAEAPKRAAEEAKRERESIIASTGGARYRHNTLLDTRYSAEPLNRRRNRPAPRLRAERNAERQKALALLVVLAIALAWAASTLIQF